MADKKIIAVEVKVIETGAKKVSDGTAKVTKDLRLLTQAERLARIEAEKLKISNLAVVTSLKQEAAAALQAEASLKGHKATSGLNNAILLETSRLASDASYGFQGMANNLGQIVSLMQISAQNAGGFGASLKELGKSIFGVGGVLIAVQLLISFLPKLEKAFKKSKSAVEEETAAFRENTKEVERNLAKRKLLAGQAEGLADSFSVDFIRNFQNGLQLLDSTDVALEEIFERFNQFGVQNADIIKDETIANDARLEISFRLLDIFREETQIKNIRLKQDKELAKAAEEGRDVNQSALAQFAQDIIQRRLEIRSLNEEIERLRKRGIVLTPPKEDEKGKKRYKRDFLRFTQEIFQARKVLRDALTSDEEAQIRDFAFLEKQKLREERDAFIEAQAQRLKDGLITEKQFKETKIQAAEELQTALVAINRKTEVLISTFRLDQQDKANEQEALNYRDRIKLELENSLLTEQIEGKRAGERLKLQEMALSSRIEANKQFLDSETLNAVERAELQSQITQDEIKQSAIRMKIADAEANARVQSFELIANGLTALSDVVGRETEVGRGLAVTSTLISTYSAAQKAYESQFLPIPTSSSPIRAELARGVAIIQGLASVKSILSADKSGANSMPKSNVQVEAPDFNVVGASPESQLAQSVSMQQNQPIKAFVVSRDMTNQQELDRVVTNTASL